MHIFRKKFCMEDLLDLGQLHNVYISCEINFSYTYSGS